MAFSGSGNDIKTGYFSEREREREKGRTDKSASGAF